MSVARAQAVEADVELNRISLEEDVLCEQVTSEKTIGGDQYNIINIGMQEASIWGAAGWIELVKLGAQYDVGDL